jgi:hypothetical protein
VRFRLFRTHIPSTRFSGLGDFFLNHPSFSMIERVLSLE